MIKKLTFRALALRLWLTLLTSALKFSQCGNLTLMESFHTKFSFPYFSLMLDYESSDCRNVSQQHLCLSREFTDPER